VPDVLPADFFDHYLYVPSGSFGLPRHFNELAEWSFAEGLIGRGDLLVDVGCNEGLLLAAAARRGARVLGIDPAQNIGERARALGVPVALGRLTPALAERVRSEHGPARLVSTTNTLNHVDDLDAFFEAAGSLLSDRGRLLVEVPRAAAFLRDRQFDTLYHEHLSVFSVGSLVDVGSRHGFGVVAFRELSIHGGSMRVVLELGAAHHRSALSAATAEEQRAGLLREAAWRAFAESTLRLRERLLEVLRARKARGERVCGYGAPAKATTLLNYCGVGRDLLECIADRNTLKQGLLCPGTDIPIVAPEQLRAADPDAIVILAWNFAEEIVEQLSGFRGDLVLPLPEPRVLPRP